MELTRNLLICGGLSLQQVTYHKRLALLDREPLGVPGVTPCNLRLAGTTSGLGRGVGSRTGHKHR